MTTFLKSLSITNFRSISGNVNVLLDAPIVLIHGPNAAGKTSVMSAIELALTGHIEAFKSDQTYVQHLVHRGADASKIELTANEESLEPTCITVSGGKISGRPMLVGARRQFFNERCFLGQTLLSRLLEIYEGTGVGRKESPLTRFVNELLGVDTLDALIDGLALVGDVRNIRNKVPEYKRAELRLEKLREVVAERRQALKETDARRVAARESALKSARKVFGEIDESVVDSIAAIDRLAKEAQLEVRLRTLTTRRIELEGLLFSFNDLRLDSATRSLRDAEKLAKAARERYDEWVARDGAELAGLLARLDKDFPGLANPAVVSPKYALESTATVVQQELDRCLAQMKRDSENRAKIKQIDDEIARVRTRLSRIDEQAKDDASASEGLARVLSDLVPHIHSDECPVCGRDYAELGAGPLINKVRATLNRLSENAGRLRQLSSERNESHTMLSKLEKDRERLKAAEISREAIALLKARSADLGDAVGSLHRLRTAVDKGAALYIAVNDEDRRVATLAKHDTLQANVKRSIAEARKELDVSGIKDDPDLRIFLAQITHAFREREKQVSELVSGLSTVRSAVLNDISLKAEQERERASLDEDEAEIKRLRAQVKEADSQRVAAKAIRDSATRARSNVVRRVFTQSLNKLWHDLFIRLAPDEAFVPSFKIPKPDRGILRVELETVHRRGGTGGPPSAMLSSGNLNTAALTLFLALHLSVDPQVPLLMLDDPVQSMDEVHTIQLAALLRMLSKEQRTRQIVIAIHERSLFDYLAFELAPSFEGDRLITVKLSDEDGETTADCDVAQYEPETAVA